MFQTQIVILWKLETRLNFMIIICNLLVGGGHLFLYIHSVYFNYIKSLYLFQTHTPNNFSTHTTDLMVVCLTC